MFEFFRRKKKPKPPWEEYDAYFEDELDAGRHPMSYKDWKASRRQPPSDGATNHNWSGQPLR